MSKSVDPECRNFPNAARSWIGFPHLEKKKSIGQTRVRIRIYARVIIKCRNLDGLIRLSHLCSSSRPQSAFSRVSRSSCTDSRSRKISWLAIFECAVFDKWWNGDQMVPPFASSFNPRDPSRGCRELVIAYRSLA